MQQSCGHRQRSGHQIQWSELLSRRASFRFSGAPSRSSRVANRASGVPNRTSGVRFRFSGVSLQTSGVRSKTSGFASKSAKLTTKHTKYTKTGHIQDLSVILCVRRVHGLLNMRFPRIEPQSGLGNGWRTGLSPIARTRAASSTWR